MIADIPALPEPTDRQKVAVAEAKLAAILDENRRLKVLLEGGKDSGQKHTLR